MGEVLWLNIFLLDIHIFITNFIIAKSLPTNLWCLEQMAVSVDVFYYEALASNLCLQLETNSGEI